MHLCVSLLGVVQKSSKLNDLSQKPLFETVSNSVSTGLKRDGHKDLYNMDKLACNNTITESIKFIKRSDKLYRRSKKPEQELNKLNEDCYYGTHLLIRIFSIDYKVIFIL